jgi:hypothetical protein
MDTKYFMLFIILICLLHIYIKYNEFDLYHKKALKNVENNLLDKFT